MRYLLADIGNTRAKIKLAEGDVWKDWDGQPVDRALAAVTGVMPDWECLLPGVEVEVLSADTPLPIGIDYLTPQTLGADRKAAACGARVLCNGKGTVIIDAGTCITIDYLDREGTYRGGAILPGIEMRFKALNAYTARLPLVDKGEPGCKVCGQSTIESIRSGVMAATRFEIEGYLRHYRGIDPDTQVVMAGGDARWVQVENAIIEPDLVLIGLKEVCGYLDRTNHKYTATR